MNDESAKKQYLFKYRRFEEWLVIRRLRVSFQFEKTSIHRHRKSRVISSRRLETAYRNVICHE